MVLAIQNKVLIRHRARPVQPHKIAHAAQRHQRVRTLGSISALMGSTGAGRKTHLIPAQRPPSRRPRHLPVPGYYDITGSKKTACSVCSVVRETLTFNVFLRYVPDNKNPTERMKRLKIGVELAADPKSARPGRSYQVLYGNMGKHCRNIVDYIKSIPGVASCKGLQPCNVDSSVHWCRCEKRSRQTRPASLLLQNVFVPPGYCRRNGKEVVAVLSRKPVRDVVHQKALCPVGCVGEVRGTPYMRLIYLALLFGFVFGDDSTSA
ncbi:hypothetical protein F442_10049 [Phytophthora nicotianae P10297]|uniref:Uncharacterized protein n=1 Tax=Phytophthora nicotianae P10297 TaxID=1317064 RepID=W2Z6V0_PHYNI|nr:hypothetical protein F442_10049 [Phytophthora nicotianae P10297]